MLVYRRPNKDIGRAKNFGSKVQA